MPRHLVTLRWALLFEATAVAWACTDAPTIPTAAPAPTAADAPASGSVEQWDELVTTRWNKRTTDLLQRYGAPSNGQAWASRMLTYLSLAQYRAALMATAPETHASVDAAVARASVDVLSNFYVNFHPALVATFEEELRTDGNQQNLAYEDVAAGDAIGREAALSVRALMAADQYGVALLPEVSTTEGAWYTHSAVVRSLYGVTPFFLHHADLMFTGEPPAIGSHALHDAAAEVYAIINVSPELRAQQLAIALKWNKVSPFGPFTAGEWNRIGVELIEGHRFTEAEASRILAYANVAAFDAQIICFTTKFYWWIPRPWQVDSRIQPLLAFTTPNHPSYPSAHSCISGAFTAVLSHAFPSDRDMLQATLEEAGMSRIYAGIHYLFDVEAGREVGAYAAAKALAGSLE